MELDPWQADADSAALFNIRSIIANAGWLIVAQIVSGVSQFVRAVLIARFLGPLSYGHWGFAFAYVNLFAAAADLGLSTLAVRDLSQGAKVGAYLGTAAALKLVLNLCLLVLMVGLAQPITHDPQTRHLIYLMGAQMLLASLTLLVHCAFRARERMAIEAGINSAAAVLTLVAVAALVEARASVEALASAFLLVTGAGFAASAVVLVRAYVPERFEFRLALARDLVRDSWPIGLGMVTTALYYFFDRVFMGVLGQDVQIGWYTAAYAPTLWFAGIVSMVRTAFLPAQARVAEVRTGHQALHAYYARLSLGLGLPVAAGGLLLARPLLVAVYGEPYAPGAFALRLLSLTTAAMFLASFFGSQLLVSGRQRRYLAVVLMGAAANMALNVMLIPRWSLNGAATATLAAEVCVLGFAWWQVRGEFGPAALLRAARAPAIATLVLVAVAAPLAGVAPVWVVIALAGSAYACAGWKLGLVRPEARRSDLHEVRPAA